MNIEKIIHCIMLSVVTILVNGFMLGLIFFTDAPLIAAIVLGLILVLIDTVLSYMYLGLFGVLDR